MALGSGYPMRKRRAVRICNWEIALEDSGYTMRSRPAGKRKNYTAGSRGNGSESPFEAGLLKSSFIPETDSPEKMGIGVDRPEKAG